MKKIINKAIYYVNRAVFGIVALFIILIGGRGIGKTYSTQNYCLRRFFKHGEKFLWMRLTENSAKKLLERDAADFLDSQLIEKWKITDIKVKGDVVYLNGKEAARILPLSTFYNSKGVALNKKGKAVVRNKELSESESKALIKKEIKKYRTIVLDEMNREKNEAKRFSISYAFVSQLENICRLDTDRRIILLGNTLDEASDILAESFNFIPEDGKFGIYRLHKKRAVIHYIEDSEEYQKKRAISIAGILAPNESTFTNSIKSDLALIEKKKVGNPSFIIRFSNTVYFTVCGNVVTRLKQPPHSKLAVIAMKPYLAGYSFYKDKFNRIIEMAQQRLFTFDKMITLKLFYKEIKNLK